MRRLDALKTHERRLLSLGIQRIAGVDEAGRGPLAGPVVAAACIVPDDFYLSHLNDSKKLTEEKREELFSSLLALPHGIGIVDAATIDHVNILEATFLAMTKAVEALDPLPDYLLIDGNRLPPISIPKEAIVDGDALSISIAAASILAKVTRDRIMLEMDALWPEYGFRQHKGYGTMEHMAALQKLGPCPVHRLSFGPVAQPRLF